MHSIQKQSLSGYNASLEIAIQNKFEEFKRSTEPTSRRAALAAMASLTALRTPAFIAAYEKALGIPGEHDA